MMLLTIMVAFYTLFNDIFIANETLNNAALFTMCLIAFGATMYRFKHILL